MLESIARDPTTGRFVIRAPSGSIEVSVNGDDLHASRTYELHPGHQLLDLVVGHNVGLLLSLRDGDTVLPASLDWLAMPEEVGGDGTVTSLRMDAKGLRLAVTRPGRYRFTVPVIDGYEPIPEQEVLVPERGFAEHVVQLVRSP